MVSNKRITRYHAKRQHRQRQINSMKALFEDSTSARRLCKGYLSHGWLSASDGHRLPGHTGEDRGFKNNPNTAIKNRGSSLAQTRSCADYVGNGPRSEPSSIPTCGPMLHVNSSQTTFLSCLHCSVRKKVQKAIKV